MKPILKLLAGILIFTMNSGSTGWADEPVIATTLATETDPWVAPAIVESETAALISEVATQAMIQDAASNPPIPATDDAALAAELELLIESLNDLSGFGAFDFSELDELFSEPVSFTETTIPTDQPQPDDPTKQPTEEDFKKIQAGFTDLRNRLKEGKVAVEDAKKELAGLVDKYLGKPGERRVVKWSSLVMDPKKFPARLDRDITLGGMHGKIMEKHYKETGELIVAGKMQEVLKKNEDFRNAWTNKYFLPNTTILVEINGLIRNKQENPSLSPMPEFFIVHEEDPVVEEAPPTPIQVIDQLITKVDVAKVPLTSEDRDKLAMAIQSLPAGKQPSNDVIAKLEEFMSVYWKRFGAQNPDQYHHFLYNLELSCTGVATFVNNASFDDTQVQAFAFPWTTLGEDISRDTYLVYFLRYSHKVDPKWDYTMMGAFADSLLQIE